MVIRFTGMFGSSGNIIHSFNHWICWDKNCLSVYGVVQPPAYRCQYTLCKDGIFSWRNCGPLVVSIELLFLSVPRSLFRVLFCGLFDECPGVRHAMGEAVSTLLTADAATNPSLVFLHQTAVAPLCPSEGARRLILHSSFTGHHNLRWLTTDLCRRDLLPSVVRQAEEVQRLRGRSVDNSHASRGHPQSQWWPQQICFAAAGLLGFGFNILHKWEYNHSQIWLNNQSELKRTLHENIVDQKNSDKVSNRCLD